MVWRSQHQIFHHNPLWIFSGRILSIVWQTSSRSKPESSPQWQWAGRLRGSCKSNKLQRYNCVIQPIVHQEFCCSCASMPNLSFIPQAFFSVKDIFTVLMCNVLQRKLSTGIKLSLIEFLLYNYIENEKEGVNAHCLKCFAHAFSSFFHWPVGTSIKRLCPWSP